MKTIKKIKSNPMTFNYANLRKWLYLNIKFKDSYSYSMFTYMKYVNKLSTQCANYFFNTYQRDFGIEAIKPIIDYFVDQYIKIYQSNLNIFQKNAMWRKKVLDEPPKLRYILDDIFNIDPNPKLLWWNEVDPLAYRENYKEKPIKLRQNPMTFNYSNLRKWIYLYLGNFKNPDLAVEGIISEYKNQFFAQSSIYVSPAIKIVVLYYWNIYRSIFDDESVSSIQKKKLWRNMILDAPKDLDNIITHNAPQYSYTAIIPFIRSWWRLQQTH